MAVGTAAALGRGAIRAHGKQGGRWQGRWAMGAMVPWDTLIFWPVPIQR
jgi:hypothetical protein